MINIRSSTIRHDSKFEEENSQIFEYPLYPASFFNPLPNEENNLESTLSQNYYLLSIVKRGKREGKKEFEKEDGGNFRIIAVFTRVL